MPTPATNGKIVLIGGSAGALEALKCIVSVLPRDLSAPVFVVLHVSAEAPSYIPQILSSLTGLKVVHPDDGEKLEKGTIYVAKPDFHMLLEDGKIRMSRGPRENRHRPAIDPLFRTGARLFGSRVIGVILSGAMDDGAVGLAMVKHRGGTAIVQDPKDALVGQMPQTAMEYIQPDYVLPASEIGKTVAQVVGSRISASNGDAGRMQEKGGTKRKRKSRARSTWT